MGLVFPLPSAWGFTEASPGPRRDVVRAVGGLDPALVHDPVEAVQAGVLVPGVAGALGPLPDVGEVHPRLRVLVFGRGPLETELRQAIADQGLAENVHMMGFVNNLPELLGCLDLLVHPAEMEGLGVSLLQASAARVPIIASRAGGMPEAVRDGDNGVLVAPGDVPALAAAMNRLLDDAPLRARMGEAGRALVLREFSTEVMCEGNLAVYRTVLEGRSR